MQLGEIDAVAIEAKAEDEELGKKARCNNAPAAIAQR
jgi:hypothetical protein